MPLVSFAPSKNAAVSKGLSCSEVHQLETSQAGFALTEHVGLGQSINQLQQATQQITLVLLSQVCHAVHSNPLSRTLAVTKPALVCCGFHPPELGGLSKGAC